VEDLQELLDPKGVERIVSAAAETSGARVRLVRAGDEAGGDAGRAPVCVGGRAAGCEVVVEGGPGNGQWRRGVASRVADELGRAATAEADLASLSQEIADRYEELNFLYDMSAAVGSAADEATVCRYIVERAEDVLACQRCSIMLLDEAGERLSVVAQTGLPENVAQSVSVPVGRGISGRVAATGRPVVAASEEQMPEDALGAAALANVDHFACYPLVVSTEQEERPRALGVLNVTRRRDGKPFGSSELKLMSAIACFTATHIRNCRLIRMEREKVALEHELELAAGIQEGLLPSETFEREGLRVASSCRLAQNVGGDYFDYWEVRPGTLGVVIADVSGHNLAAALLAGSFRSTIRAQAALGLGVARTVSSVNEVMFDDLCRVEMFLSLFYLEYDFATGHLDYCRAGHPKPLWLRADGPAWLDTEGPLVGILPKAFYEQRSIRLGPGETLVLYTDGIIEAGPEADLFSEGKLLETALSLSCGAAEEIAGRLMEAAVRHMGSCRQVDDMAVVVMKR
jgi:hypothetical protein